MKHVLSDGFVDVSVDKLRGRGFLDIVIKNNDGEILTQAWVSDAGTVCVLKVYGERQIDDTYTGIFIRRKLKK